MNQEETCGTCGGDRTITNSFGSHTTCPSCRGSGRRTADTGFHDVTKTKPSHHVKNNVPVEKQTWPSTAAGAQLASDVKATAGLTDEAKARITREIILHEISHGPCTQTFIKKVRKQIKAAH